MLPAKICRAALLLVNWFFEKLSYHKAPVSVSCFWLSDWPPVWRQMRDLDLSARSWKLRLWVVVLCILDPHPYRNCLLPLRLLVQWGKHSAMWDYCYFLIFFSQLLKATILCILKSNPNPIWYFLDSSSQRMQMLWLNLLSSFSHILQKQ